MSMRDCVEVRPETADYKVLLANDLDVHLLRVWAVLWGAFAVKKQTFVFEDFLVRIVFGGEGVLHWLVLDWSSNVDYFWIDFYWASGVCVLN